MKKERQRIDVKHALISLIGKSIFTVNVYQMTRFLLKQFLVFEFYPQKFQNE
jgi:hypothetical protein